MTSLESPRESFLLFSLLRKHPAPFPPEMVRKVKGMERRKAGHFSMPQSFWQVFAKVMKDISLASWFLLLSLELKDPEVYIRHDRRGIELEPRNVTDPISQARCQTNKQVAACSSEQAGRVAKGVWPGAEWFQAFHPTFKGPDRLALSLMAWDVRWTGGYLCGLRLITWSSMCLDAWIWSWTVSDAWAGPECFRDSEFADDIALLSITLEQAQPAAVVPGWNVCKADWTLY